jgi:phosphatidylserine/phosphatidylglycerophosphate/cardiolipin synthase-like enzyme
MRIALAVGFALSALSASACLVGDLPDPEVSSITDEGPDTDEVDLDMPELDGTAIIEDSPEVDMLDAQPTLTSPGCTARGTLGGRVAWIHFARPLNNPCEGTPGRDRHVLKELRRLIASVPPGGRIDGHIFSISVPSVAKALLDAQTNGVTVVISTDGQMADAKNAAKKDYLDKLDHHVYCKQAGNHACISTADGGISHTKLFVFSTATAPDGTVANNVVWFGSANQTYGSGMDLSNNTVTIYGATDLYGKFRSYLDDLYTRKRTADYYDASSGRGRLLSGPADVYVSPESQTDLIVNRLDDIAPDADCRIRVMEASFRASRTNVIDELAKLKNGGCKVYVVSHNVAPAALKALHKMGVKPHDTRVHDKAIIVYAKFKGGATGYQYQVFTGSHNLSAGSAHAFDEIFVKLDAERGANHPIYDAYVRHFSDAYSIGPAR